MDAQSLGMLVLGLGGIMAFGLQLYKVFVAPGEAIRDQLQRMRIQDLEYQNQMISQFGELNQRLSVQDEKVERLGIRVDNNKADIKDVHLRVAQIERNRREETQIEK